MFTYVSCDYQDILLDNDTEIQIVRVPVVYIKRLRVSLSDVINIFPKYHYFNFQI